MEKRITFQSMDCLLEGLLEDGAGEKSVVVTHPHPLYGGDMDNTVVESICRAYRQKDYTTLRFNFRGIGGSQGRYDNGIDEQQDVLAAQSYLQEMGFERIDLAGYSFGTWINAQVGCSGAFLQEMIMVSPPVAFIDFDHIPTLPCLKLVVTGSQDDFAPPDQVKRTLPKWSPSARFEQIEGADHFYGGYLSELESLLSRSLSTTRRIQ